MYNKYLIKNRIFVFMKVVVDDKIPFIHEAIEQIADSVIYRPGSAITADDVRNADVLIVRTRTKCDRKLLEGSRIKFIATATIGFDHLDLAFLKENGIAWSNCPGCNANSVGQYIYSCLLLLHREKGLDLHNTTIGIVGAGHVGIAVKKAITPLGVRVLLNDPPRQSIQQNNSFTGERETFFSLKELQEQCNIISFHTPLIRNGAHPTYHVADETFFDQLKQKPIIINTSRGEVIDNSALLCALEKECVQEAIIDTWENEPHINLALLNKVYIGTPHIAGYSADGKANATRMALDAICLHFNLPRQFHIDPPCLPATFNPSEDKEELALQLYNPHRDDLRLKAHPELFEEMRGNYPLRREKM